MSLYFVCSSAHQNSKAAPCGKSCLAGNTFQLFNSNHVWQSCLEKDCSLYCSVTAKSIYSPLVKSPIVSQNHQLPSAKKRIHLTALSILVFEKSSFPLGFHVIVQISNRQRQVMLGVRSSNLVQPLLIYFIGL